ncbi:hypothetical protein ACIGZJ_27835 [Kitasatospora sp. NPDC052868]|uniref:hypothetical protein n=1 Tax=Kitasatospora sp. NPDC052868 TaxID=3364060 RepID=UPI0037C8AB09
MGQELVLGVRARRLGERWVEAAPVHVAINACGSSTILVLGGGLMSGAIDKITGPMAESVTKKTGLPTAAVARGRN